MKKIRKIFNISSVLFISSLFIIYGYRLVHYYKIEHPKYENKQVKLFEVLINNRGIEGTDECLEKKDNKYIYASKTINNYVNFAGRLWRVISIDEDSNIRMITEEIQTLLEWDNDTLYEDTDIYRWLNKVDDNSGIFLDSLGIEQGKLVGNVELLTKDEYTRLKTNNYLSGSYWINDDGLPVYIVDGDITKARQNMALGIRPVVTINSEVLYISGTGMKDDPYVITNTLKTNLKDLYVGEYIKYNDSLWRVIEKQDDRIKIILNNTLEIDDIYNSNNVYSLSSGVGMYLNNDYYDSIVDNNYILEGEFYIGKYNTDGVYNYMSTYLNSINAKIGLPKIGDFYISDFDSIYTMTPYLTDNTIYVINNNSKLYGDYVTSKYKIRPTLYLDNTLNISDGDGSIDKPYEVSR